MLESGATSDRQRQRREPMQRREEQIRAEQIRAEQRRAERRRNQKSRAQRRVAQRDESRTEAHRLKPAVPCNEREMREPKFAGEARCFIGSAQLKCALRLSQRVRSKRRTSSASNAAHWSGSRAQLHKARA